MHHQHKHTPIASAYDAIVVGGGEDARSAALLLGQAGRRVLVIDNATDTTAPAADPAPGVTVIAGAVSEVSDITRGLRVTCTDGTVEYARGLLITPGAGVDLSGSPRVWAPGTPTGTVVTAAALDDALAEEDADNAAAAERPHTDWSDVSAEDYWERAYATSQIRWSGRPNTALVSVLGSVFGTDARQDAGPVAAPRSRGRAADIGSGEGADVVWLAEQGWDTTGVEVSATAVRRAAAVAEAAGVADRVTFTDAGLLGFRDSEIRDDGNRTGLDLVTASYLHAPSQDHRESLLQTAGTLVAPGGHLFILSHITHEHLHTGADHGAGHTAGHTAGHAAGHAAGHGASATTDEIASLGLNPTEWSPVRAENIRRTILTPGGDVVDMADRALLLQRISPRTE